MHRKASQMGEENYDPLRMYWRYAWRNREKAKLYSLPRLVPPALVSVAQFIWKHKAHDPFTEMWIAVGIIVAVYFGLFLLESLWKFVVSTPPKIYGEQIEVMQQLHGQLGVFENQPEVSATEQRRRDQVREQWHSLTPDEKAVVQFIHDRGDTDATTFNESGLNGDALRSAIHKTVKSGLILYHREERPGGNPYVSNITETCRVNPSLRDALEFVMSERHEGPAEPQE